MENVFKRKWGEKKDHEYCLTEFHALRKRPNEDVSSFIKRFNKLYASLSAEMKPHQIAAKVVFVAAFDVDFGFSLRERKSVTLDDAQTDTLEVEANFTSTGKSRGRGDHDVRRRGKEEVSTSNQDREAADHKIKEMSKMIKNLSSKLVKLELETKISSSRPPQAAPNRGFNPQHRKPPLQILQRERKEQQDLV